jgi:uncharacterized protein YuzE
MIELKYDIEADALFIVLSEADWADTHEVEDGTYVYVDAHGQPLGIEVHHPARPWPLEEILARYRLSTQETQELHAYFPQPALLPTSPHPSATVPVTVRVA